MADYVNSPAVEERNSPERRGRCLSGGSKVFMVVGVSFGLLCIVQAALNISLRLQRMQSFSCRCGSDHVNSTNITTVSTANISALLRDRELLIRENTMVHADNKWLRRRYREQENRINDLAAENDRLLTRLSERVSQSLTCRQGWTFYMSSCYRLSTEQKNWRDATVDCERSGANLVVLKDESEAEILRMLGSAVMWIGLRAQSRGQDMWLWEDGHQFTNDDRKKLQPGDPRFTCAYAEQRLSDSLKFVPADCADQHYWVCEMMVM